MEYREANIKEHEIICKQIRSKSLLYVSLMAPVIPLTILGMFLSIRMMIRDRYDKVTFVVSIVILVLLVIAVACFMITLMKGYIERISYINKHKYRVADCIVAGSDQRINPKHIHNFITVSFRDGNALRVEVPSTVYSLAETGKQALVVKYDEPEGKKKKLPFEVAVAVNPMVVQPHPKAIEAEGTGKTTMTRDMFFECCNNMCDWDKSGDDELVVKPLVEYLAKLSDEDIFAFEDIMSELLYEIDTKQNYETALRYDTHNDDTFLYSRCIAIVNGKDYFDKVKSGIIKDIWKMEFEAILYVAREAWAKKHGKSTNDFPHIPPVSYETGSNKDGWN